MEQVSDRYILAMLDKLYTLAIVKQEAIAGAYGGFHYPYFQEKAKSILKQDWKDFADDLFFELAYEAAKRRLGWVEKPLSEEEKFKASDKKGLLRFLVGALRDAINCHGPVTKKNLSSAAKRLFGAVLVYNHERSRHNGDSSRT